MKRFPKKLLFQIFLISLGVANIVIWIYIAFLYHQSKKKSTSLDYIYQDIKRIDLPCFTLSSFEGKEFSSEELDAKLNILIFFSLSDCSICLFEAEYWGVVDKSFNKLDVKVWGISQTGNNEKIEKFRKEYNISFPILYDGKANLKKKFLSIKAISKMNIYTPFKIFLTSQKKIVKIEGATKNIEDQSKFPERVLLLLKNLDNT